jgi:ABC-type multidrug transport system fused ATPase/permease subunit
MLLNAITELGTIGSVLPLLALISHPDSLNRYPWVLDVLLSLGAVTTAGQLIATTAIFAAFVIASGILRSRLSSSTFAFGFDLLHELTLEVQRRLLLQPYSFHVQRNTSTLVGALSKAEILVFEVVIPLTQAFIAAFISLAIIAVLIGVEPITTLVAATLLSSFYVVISAVTKSRLAANSQVISRGIDEQLKIIQESLGGIRDVLIDGSQEAYLAQLDREDSKLGRARADNANISLAPRFLIETVGIVAIAVTALTVSFKKGGFAAALPGLGAIALGAQRLLPLVQQVYRGWSAASGHLSVIGETVELLSLPVDEAQVGPAKQPPLPLRQKITVENLCFTYPNRADPALEGISFEVPAGSATALVGLTGSGKSTLADLLMGLLEPDSGQICIDGAPLAKHNRRRWQRSIAHVPQSIFLADASIARNIALGCPDREIDVSEVIRAAKLAQLHEFVSALPEKYDTFVGERGIRLSGGQRQRLGLARAIYKRAPVLVLDEPTSALDYQTEAAVIRALEELRREGSTIIIIAHRLSTVSNCDFVARLEHGQLAGFAPAEDLLEPRGDAAKRLSRKRRSPTSE